MRIKKSSRVSSSTKPSEEVISSVDTAYIDACTSIKNAIDSLCKIDSDPAVEDAIANLSVILFDLQK